VPPATRTPEPEARRVWAAELPPSARLVTSEAGTRVDCNPAPLPASTWQQDYKIDPQRLAYSWDAIVLWKEDEQAQITINLPQARDISRIAVRTMWTNNSKLGIRYRLKSLSIAAAKTRNGAFETIQTFEETEEHAVPSYPEYSVDTPGLQAQAIRITAEPRDGCALFLQGIRAWGAPEPAREARADYERWETGPVSALCAGKLGQTGVDCVVYGCRDGKVTVLEQGKQLWTVETGARVNSLAAADLTGDGRPELLVGTNDQRILCLDAVGEELWHREFPDFWGRRGNVMWVGAGDVDGDGDNEVVLSCENWHYYCLDHEGKTIWSYEIQHSGLKGALGDINGDGKLETLCGEEYYGWTVLGSEGKPLFNVGGSGPVTTAVLAGDITGDGVSDVVFGNQTFGVYARDGKGGVLYNAAVPGFVNDLATLSTDGAPRLIAAVDGLSRNLIAFGGDGQRAWQVTLPAAPLALAQLPGVIAAGCQDGGLRLIAPDGRVLRAETLQGPVTHVVAGDFDGDGEVEVCGVGDRELVVVEWSRERRRTANVRSRRTSDHGDTEFHGERQRRTTENV